MTDGSAGGATQCPLCGAAARFWCRAPDRHYGIPGQWEVHECSACEHRFQWPIPSEDQLAGHYPDSYYAFQAPSLDFQPRGLRRRGVWLRLHYLKHDRGYDGLPVRRSWFLARCAQMMRRFPLDFGSPAYRPGGVLLDYGSGTGEAVAFAGFTGWEAEGIEMNPKAAAAGRQAGLRIHEGTIDVLEAHPGRYDHIVSSHCVEHVPDVRRLFMAFSSALKPGGTIAVDVPNGRSVAAERFQDRYYHLTMPVHVHLFSPRSLEALAGSAGFTRIRLATYSRLSWHTESQLLRPQGNGGRDGVAFHSGGRMDRARASLLGLPSFLRSRRPLLGDCLVLTAVKGAEPADTVEGSRPVSRSHPS